MDFRNEVVFEVKKEDRVYRMHLPSGAPLGEAYEACGAFLDKIISMIMAHSENLKPKTLEEVEKKEEDAKEE